MSKRIAQFIKLCARRTFEPNSIRGLIVQMMGLEIQCSQSRGHHCHWVIIVQRGRNCPPIENKDHTVSFICCQDEHLVTCCDPHRVGPSVERVWIDFWGKSAFQRCLQCITRLNLRPLPALMAWQAKMLGARIVKTGKNSPSCLASLTRGWKLWCHLFVDYDSSYCYCTRGQGYNRDVASSALVSVFMKPRKSRTFVRFRTCCMV